MNVVECGIKKSNAVRNRLYRLRNIGRSLSARQRVRWCGISLLNDDVAVIGSTGGSVCVKNALSCGSIHECALCRARICAERAKEIREAIYVHKQELGKVYLLTLTIRHGIGDDLKHMRKMIAQCWRFVCQGKSWQQFKCKYGLKYIRGAEQTYGKNGWHPHLHILLMSDCDLPVEEVREYISDRWASIVLNKMGESFVPRQDKVGVDLRESIDGEDYITKLGLEMSQHASKRAKEGGKTALQILESSVEDKKYRSLWRKYTKSMKGARVLTWSRGLRKKVGILDLTDEQIIENLDKKKIDKIHFYVEKRCWNQLSADGDMLSRWFYEIEKKGEMESLMFLRKYEKYKFLSYLLEGQLGVDDSVKLSMFNKVNRDLNHIRENYVVSGKYRERKLIDKKLRDIKQKFRNSSYKEIEHKKSESFDETRRFIDLVGEYDDVKQLSLDRVRLNK